MYNKALDISKNGSLNTSSKSKALHNLHLHNRAWEGKVLLQYMLSFEGSPWVSQSLAWNKKSIYGNRDRLDIVTEKFLQESKVRHQAKADNDYNWHQKVN